MKTVLNPNDDVSLLRIINTPTRGIGKKTIDRLLDLAAQRGQGVWQALIAEAAGPAASAKRLAEYVALMERLRGQGGGRLHELGRAVVEDTGYLKWLEEQDSAEADARIQNVLELLGSMEQAQGEQVMLGFGLIWGFGGVRRSRGSLVHFCET